MLKLSDRSDSKTDTRILLEAISNDKIHLARFILDALDGKIIDSESEGAQTPLVSAVFLRDAPARSRFMNLLLQRGASVNRPDESGRTALSYACEMGYLDAVKILVKSGADPEAADAWGNTALMYAVVAGRPAIVEFLVRAFKRLGLQIDRQNKVGNSAVEVAKHLGHTECLQALSSHSRRVHQDTLAERLSSVSIDEDERRPERRAGGDEDERRPRRRAGGDEDERRPERRAGGDEDERRPRRRAGRDEYERRPERRAGGDEDERRPERRAGGDEDERRPRRRAGGDEDERRPERRAGGDEDERRPERRAGDEDERRPRRRAGDEDERRPRRRAGDEDERRPERRAGDEDERRPERRAGGDEDERRPERRAGGDEDERRPERRAGGDRTPLGLTRKRSLGLRNRIQSMDSIEEYERESDASSSQGLMFSGVSPPQTQAEHLNNHLPPLFYSPRPSKTPPPPSGPLSILLTPFGKRAKEDPEKAKKRMPIWRFDDSYYQKRCSLPTSALAPAAPQHSRSKPLLKAPVHAGSRSVSALGGRLLRRFTFPELKRSSGEGCGAPSRAPDPSGRCIPRSETFPLGKNHPQVGSKPSIDSISAVKCEFDFQAKAAPDV